MGKGKALLAVLLTCATILTACGNEITASEKALSRAQNAVDVGEQYLSGSINADEAYKKVSDIQDELSYISEYTKEEKSEDSQKMADSIIYSCVFGLKINLITEKTGGNADSYSKVKESVSDIKEKIKKYQ